MKELIIFLRQPYIAIVVAVMWVFSLFIALIDIDSFPFIWMVIINLMVTMVVTLRSFREY
jgi:hypothetical protein